MNIILFSAVEGTLFHEGKPLKDVEVKQRYSWLGMDGGEASTKTDAAGRYRFPARPWKGKKPKKNEDIFITQEITTRYQDTKYILWQTTKYNLQENGELGGHPIRMKNELTAPANEIFIPTFNDMRSDVEGVFELDHPYARDFAAAQAALKNDHARLVEKLLDYTQRKETIERVSAQLYNSDIQQHRVQNITAIASCDVKDLALVADERLQSTSLEKNPYTHFTVSGDLVVAFDNGESLSVHYWWPGAVLKLDRLLAHDLDLLGDYHSFDIDGRAYLKKSLAKLIETGKLLPVVRELLRTQPGPEIHYALDPKLNMDDWVYRQKALAPRYKPHYEIADLQLTSHQVDFVKIEKDYALIRTGGTLAVAGAKERHAFSGAFYIALSSVNTNSYKVGTDKECTVSFSLPTFRAHMELDEKSHSPLEAIPLRFTVTNLLDKENVFLIWHTPFEGFMNNFLKIVKMDDGKEIPYEGPLVSRTPPTKEGGSFLEFAPHESRTASIDIREAYTLKEKGRYRIEFTALGGSAYMVDNAVEFEIR